MLVPGILRVGLIGTDDVPSHLMLESFVLDAPLPVPSYYLSAVEWTDDAHGPWRLEETAPLSAVSPREAALSFCTEEPLGLADNLGQRKRYCFLVQTADGTYWLMGCHEQVPEVIQTRRVDEPSGRTVNEVTVSLRALKPLIALRVDN